MSDTKYKGILDTKNEWFVPKEVDSKANLPKTDAKDLTKKLLLKNQKEIERQLIIVDEDIDFRRSGLQLLYAEKNRLETELLLTVEALDKVNG